VLTVAMLDRIRLLKAHHPLIERRLHRPFAAKTSTHMNQILS
jgi:hypothetical protein